MSDRTDPEHLNVSHGRYGHCSVIGLSGCFKLGASTVPAPRVGTVAATLTFRSTVSRWHTARTLVVTHQDCSSSAFRRASNRHRFQVGLARTHISLIFAAAISIDAPDTGTNDAV
jgi:hypothetical protein